MTSLFDLIIPEKCRYFENNRCTQIKFHQITNEHPSGVYDVPFDEGVLYTGNKPKKLAVSCPTRGVRHTVCDRCWTSRRKNKDIYKIG